MIWRIYVLYFVTEYILILVFGARNNPDEAATNYVGRQIQVHYLIYSNQFFEYERSNVFSIWIQKHAWT